jgi:hypothetical protein
MSTPTYTISKDVTVTPHAALSPAGNSTVSNVGATISYNTSNSSDVFARVNTSSTFTSSGNHHYGGVGIQFGGRFRF